LLFRHWNSISDTLARGEVYVPIFTQFENEVPQGNQWAHGFMRGLSMRHGAWQELMDDEECGGCLIPMMAFDHEHDPDPELRTRPIAPEKRMDFLAYMGLGLLRAYEYFKPHRQREAQEFAQRQGEPQSRSPKIGRKEPCPCGSGKKYNRCCGNMTVQ